MITENTLPRLKSAIEELEVYQSHARSAWLETILYDLRVVKSELAGEERPILDAKKYRDDWIGFGMKNKFEIKIKF